MIPLQCNATLAETRPLAIQMIEKTYVEVRYSKAVVNFYKHAHIDIQCSQQRWRQGPEKGGACSSLLTSIHASTSGLLG